MVSEYLANNQLSRILPPILRAREYWLYSKSARYLDMYLGEGRALYGYRPLRLTQTIKNTLSKGIYPPYPNIALPKINAIMQRRFPNNSHIVIYATRTRALRELSTITGFSIQAEHLLDPALPPSFPPLSPTPYPKEAPVIGFSRPYIDTPKADIIFPVTPLPWPDAPQIVCASPQWNMLRGDAISPVLLSALKHTLLLEHSTNPSAKLTEWRSRTRSDWIQPASVLRKDIANHKWSWNISSQYLVWNGSSERYQKLVRALLEKLIIIHPYPRGVSIIPFVCSANDYLRFKTINDRMRSHG